MRTMLSNWPPPTMTEGVFASRRVRLQKADADFRLAVSKAEGVIGEPTQPLGTQIHARRQLGRSLFNLARLAKARGNPPRRDLARASPQGAGARCSLQSRGKPSGSEASSGLLGLVKT